MSDLILAAIAIENDCLVYTTDNPAGYPASSWTKARNQSAECSAAGRAA